MKQSKLVFVLIAVIFVTSLFSCTQNNSSQNSNVTSNVTKVGLITDLGGINDHSFNELSYAGLNMAHNENPDIEISYLESKSFSDYNLNIETYVNNGTDLIILVGATFIETLIDAATTYPNQNFAIVGVSLPMEFKNVACFTFANEQSSYLCGVASAMLTKTNTIGYVQGMAIDAMNLFGIGYIEGAKSIKKDINILQYNANNFADLLGGNVAATNMIKNNADIIYHAAGATGIGVINACVDNNIYAIGCDIDQSDIAPNNILLSSIQSADLAVKEYVLDLRSKGFKSGIIESNLSNGKVDIAYNNNLIDKIYIDKIEMIKKDIIDGKIKVSKTKEECPDFTLAD